MAPSARPQFGKHGFEKRRLRGYEALQIEAIGLCHITPPF
jgi:hypothetical protein